MIRLLFILALLFSITSCKKVFVKLKVAEIQTTDNAPYLGIGTGTNSQVTEAFSNEKVLRISNSNEFDTLISQIQAGNSIYQPQVGGVLPSDLYSTIDFNESNLFVIFLSYEGQDGGVMKKEKIKIKESSQEIEFDLKLKVPVGGSGMSPFEKLAFFVIPADKSDYSISGSFEVNEYNLISGGHDFTVNYTQ